MSSNPLILVIEPNLDEAQSLLREIGTGPYQAILASNVAAALTHLEAPVDLVVSGIGPADPGGSDLIRQWRTKRPATPFLLITEDNGSPAAKMPLPGATECDPESAYDGALLRRIAERIAASHVALNDAAKVPPGNVTGPQPAAGESHAAEIVIPQGATLDDLERAAIEQALKWHQGNRTHAAKALGISVRTLQRKLKAWRGSSSGSESGGGSAPRNNWSTKYEPRGNAYKPRLATI
jgi:DNA-binding NtrC family response regulator